MRSPEQSLDHGIWWIPALCTLIIVAAVKAQEIRLDIPDIQPKDKQLTQPSNETVKAIEASRERQAELAEQAAKVAVLDVFDPLLATGFYDRAVFDESLRGYMDFHTHPMSYLGFGKKALFGLPGLNIPVPAGTRNCNKRSYTATSIQDALGNDNSAHGGWGTNNSCGNYLRAALINLMIDADFRDKYPLTVNAHGDHPHDGYPNFPAWPDQTSILHQQMWWEWIKRAHAGGLRAIVALTVNNETLAKLLDGDPPFNDKAVADEQIAATKAWVRWVNTQNDFMEIALSAADMRRIISEGKLAVILGMEVDRLGNFDFRSNPSTHQVTQEIHRLYDAGIRYVFPIHLIDNAFGGAAVYDAFFNLVNHDLNGSYFRLATSPDRLIRHDARVLSAIPIVGAAAAAVPGGATAASGVARGLFEGIGQIPLPPFSCNGPFPARIADCDDFNTIKNVFTLDPSWEAYNFIGRGHVNARGLTPIGEHAVREMMRLGMIIDLDHMSQRAQTRTIELAERASPNGYPLVFGHNGIRQSAPDGVNERSAPVDLVRRVADMGGMFGLGTADIIPTKFVEGYRLAAEYMGGRVGIGTDVDGFEPLPHNSFDCNESGRYGAERDNFYRDFVAETGIRGKSEIQGSRRAWDYFVECGVAHYGLMPEFLFDVKNYAGGADVYESLMRSAPNFIDMWGQAEEAARMMR